FGADPAAQVAVDRPLQGAQLGRGMTGDSRADRPRFDEGDRRPGFGEPVSRGDPGDPATDDRDLAGEIFFEPRPRGVRASVEPRGRRLAREAGHAFLTPGQPAEQARSVIRDDTGRFVRKSGLLPELFGDFLDLFRLV